MVTVDWTLDRTFPDCGEATIRVLQRQVPLEAAMIQKELEPFCCLPTLVRPSGKEGTSSLRGMVADIAFESGSLNFGIRTDDESGVLVRLRLHSVESIRLTVWRVNDKLDALQLNFESPSGWLYLQTGGELLVDLLLLDAGSAAAPIFSAKELFLANARSTVERAA